MRYLLRFVAIIVLIVVLGISLFDRVQTAQAASITGTVTMTLTCSSFDFAGPSNLHWDRDTTGSNGEYILLEAFDAAGNSLYDNSGDTANVVGSGLPLDGFTVPFGSAPLFNPIHGRLFSPAGNGLPEQTLLTATFNCPGLPTFIVPGSGAPGIPVGFVQRTIICDVAVYNQAGGTPVEGGAHIVLGQTWYVNPEPVDGPDGKSWTEIFAGGPINGWVPTVCVQ